MQTSSDAEDRGSELSLTWDGKRPGVNALGRAGVELGENGSVTPNHSEGLRSWLRLKKKPRNSFPPSEAPLAHVTHTHESSTERLDSYCVEKRKHRIETQKMKKPRTGGSGASRVPLGGNQ